MTLLELLVVMVIIAMLLSILLPALSDARRSSQAGVCMSNMKQTATAFFLYGNDHDGIIPGTGLQGAVNLDWSGRDNISYLSQPGQYRHPMESSVLGKYLSLENDILLCPSVPRRANHYFDYTMIIRMAGARTDLPWQMTYPLNPENPQSQRMRFIALPFLVEEDSRFYNDSSDDGTWCESDQITDRHAKGGHLGHLDGAVSRFVSPKGPDPNVEEPQDLKCADVRLVAMRQEFPVSDSSPGEFGWINQPE